jgi:hypothetical protein
LTLRQCVKNLEKEILLDTTPVRQEFGKRNFA